MDSSRNWGLSSFVPHQQTAASSAWLVGLHLALTFANVFGQLQYYAMDCIFQELLHLFAHSLMVVWPSVEDFAVLPG